MTIVKRHCFVKPLTIFARSAAIIVMLLAFTAIASAAGVKQGGFATPDEAVAALVAAVRAHDEAALLQLFGPAGKELVSSGDEVADRSGREKFIRAYDAKHGLIPRSATVMTLQIGADSWSLPIPLVKTAGKWRFDVKQGKQEILNRRIGRNELQVIKVMNAFVDAEHEYASKDCARCGTTVFAQKLISTPGKRDGLYWEAREGEPESPLGPLVARAAREGYVDADLSPFHGYYYRILTAQGKHAEGGAYSYLKNGKMILGFALVAYPAEYGNSGVMTFIVNQKGDVYQKNLGKKTRQLAEKLQRFDPDPSWHKVEPAAAQQ